MIESKTVESEPRTATVNAVEVVHVTKRFGSNLAANDINLAIGEGEFFSFLGPSGCGKTTLLRMIGGFEHPTEGTISISGVNMSAVPPHKRPVNMVFQNYALFPHLTIGENVAFGLKTKKVFSNSEIAERVKEALELVRLGQFKDRLPGQISGGQQQRVALARAIANDPKVLLLDEPLSALDPQIREEMQLELARLQKRLGMTFIMVTHDQNEALALSSRIAVFCQGNLEQVATPEQIYKSPATLFVAKFIGQTNVIEGEIVDSVDQCYRISTATGLELCATVRGAQLPVGSRVAALVKPAAVHFVDDHFTPPQIGKVLPVQIVNRSFQGNCTEYIVSLDGVTELRLSAVNPVVASDRKTWVGNARVFISADACDVLPL